MESITPKRKRAPYQHKVQRTCPVCGKVFSCYYSSPKQYCSYGCYKLGGLYRGTAISQTCPVCAKVFMCRADDPSICCSKKCGGIRTRSRFVERFWSKVDKASSPHGCWLWIGSKRNGYGSAKTYRGTTSTHRISWELVNGPIPKGFCVCHNCPGGDNPACVNPAHLFLGTHGDNMRDMFAKDGRATVHGEAHSKAKLTEQDVATIRHRYATEKISQAALASEYSVHQGTISSIVRGKTWKAHINTS